MNRDGSGRAGPAGAAAVPCSELQARPIPPIGRAPPTAATSMISAESIRATDHDLAGRSAAGDQTAFAEIYERYFDRIFDFVARTMRDSESAGEVTKNAFLKAWNGLRRRGAPDNLKAWLFAIARNEAIDEFRRRRLEVSLDGEENSIPAGVETDTSRTADPEAMAQDREVAGLVWRAASALSPKEYALLDMHLRQELGAEEIAGCLGVRTGNVYMMLSPAQRRRGGNGSVRATTAVGPFGMPRAGRRPHPVRDRQPHAGHAPGREEASQRVRDLSGEPAPACLSIDAVRLPRPDRAGARPEGLALGRGYRIGCRHRPPQAAPTCRRDRPAAPATGGGPRPY